MKPLRTKTIKKALYGFDIETYGRRNDFIMGSIVGSNLKKVFWDKDYFIGYIQNNARLFKDSYICATNLQFDILSLIKGTDKLNIIKPLIRNGNFLNVKLSTGNNRHYINFIDSLNFIRLSVEGMGNLLGIPKLKHPVCFGRIPQNNKEKIELEDYNVRDSYITYRFMEFLQDNFNNLGANMRITAPSTALDLFRRKYQDIEYRQPDIHILKYMYNAYYGGRCEAVKRGYVTNLKYYDINSLYPSVMLNEYPKPTRFQLVKYLRKNALYDYEGIACAEVTAPDLYIPYLPYRSKIGASNKLLFPVGRFKGYYTFYELRKALELGYTIHNITDAVIYFERFTPFRQYVLDLYKERAHYRAENNPVERIIKLLLNSLYGKFAQKIDVKETVVHVDNMPIEKIHRYDDIQRVGDWFIIKEKDFCIPRFINPIFSIYTTAYARTVLYDYMVKVGFENVFYYDTDSLLTNKRLDESIHLGKMKLVKNIDNGIIVRPKMYILDDKPTCKGFHGIDSDDFNRLLHNKPMRIRKFIKFKEANRRKLDYNEIIHYFKYAGLEDNKRIWEHRFNPRKLEDSQPITV